MRRGRIPLSEFEKRGNSPLLAARRGKGGHSSPAGTVLIRRGTPQAILLRGRRKRGGGRRTLTSVLYCRGRNRIATFNYPYRAKHKKKGKERGVLVAVFRPQRRDDQNLSILLLRREKKEDTQSFLDGREKKVRYSPVQEDEAQFLSLEGT